MASEHGRAISARAIRMTGMTSEATVTQPDSVSAVRECMHEVIASREAIRIRGAGTWQHCGAPVAAQRTLSLASLTGVVSYVPGDLTITVRAGTTLAELSHVTAAHGQWLGLDPAGDRHGTIGATIATASAGPLSHAFGTPRDLILGLEAVTGYGDIVRPGGRVVKNVAGFDLVRLFTGSCGTLGAITEVSLRLRALPTHDLTMSLTLTDPSALAALGAAMRRDTLSLLTCEWLDGHTAKRLGVSDGDDALLIRLGGNDAFVRGQRAQLRTIGPFIECGATVWGALGQLDRDASCVVRFSGAVTSLPATVARIRTALDACDVPVAIHARLGRGIVRVIADGDTSALRSALTLSGADEVRIAERLPAAWWADERDAFSSALSIGIRDAFDPYRLCNPRAQT
jgi:glycolate oxidase FAD binding subunit